MNFRLLCDPVSIFTFQSLSYLYSKIQFRVEIVWSLITPRRWIWSLDITKQDTGSQRTTFVSSKHVTILTILIVTMWVTSNNLSLMRLQWKMLLLWKRIFENATKYIDVNFTFTEQLLNILNWKLQGELTNWTDITIKILKLKAIDLKLKCNNPFFPRCKNSIMQFNYIHLAQTLTATTRRRRNT